MLLPLNEQHIAYDESFEEEYYLKLNTGEKIALQIITQDILKRFIRTDDVNLDTIQFHPVKWDELEQIKNDCVANSIYFKNEDVIRASFGKHIARRKHEEMTHKTFIESANALLKMFGIQLSQTKRETVKGKKVSNYAVCVTCDTYDIVKHKFDSSYKPAKYQNLF